MNLAEFRDRLDQLTQRVIEKGISPKNFPVFFSIDDGARVEEVADVEIEFDVNPEPGIYIGADAGLE